MPDGCKYIINPGITFVDAQERNSLLRVSIGQKQLLIDPWVYELINALTKNNVSDRLFNMNDFAYKHGKNPVDIESTIEYLVAYDILIPKDESSNNGERTFTIESDRHVLNQMVALTAKKAVLDSEKASTLGRAFAWIFRVPLIIAINVLFFPLLIIAIFNSVAHFKLLIDPYTTIYYSAICMPILVCVSVAIGLLHECGHLGAAVSCGCKVGEVGIGIYITSIALYTNMNDSNISNKIDRLKIDLGGITVECLILDILIIVAFFANNVYLYIAVITLGMHNLDNLNPFEKSDGYWVYSDYFEIPNLHIRLEEMVKSILARRTDFQDRNTYSKNVAIYTTLCILFFLIAAITAILLAPQYITQYPSILTGFIESAVASVNSLDIGSTAFNSYLLCAAIVPIVGIVFMTKKAFVLLRKNGGAKNA